MSTPQRSKDTGQIDHMSYDNLLQGPPMSEWAPELDRLLNELMDEEANEADEADETSE